MFLVVFGLCAPKAEEMGAGGGWGKGDVKALSASRHVTPVLHDIKGGLDLSCFVVQNSPKNKLLEV
jgi:hypothetical protein